VLVVHTDRYGCALHSFTENPSQVCTLSEPSASRSLTRRPVTSKSKSKSNQTLV